MTPKTPPGPPGHFLLGHLPAMRREGLDFFTRLARDYGDVAAYRMGPRRVWFINHPDLIEFVLSTGSKHFKKSFAYGLIVPVVGHGLLTTDGPFWLRQRRLAQPAFHRQKVAGFGDVMVDYTRRLLDRWQPGETRDVHADMMRLTLEIAAKTLFDFDVGEDAADVGHCLEVVQENFGARFESLIPLPVWLPTPSNRRLRRSVERLDRIIYAAIEQRRKNPADNGDLLSTLLHARDEDDGGQMTDKQLRDEAMTLFLAGHETTALALSWAWYLLAQHPEAGARMLAELRDVLGDRPPTVADLPRLRYTEGVVQETLRLYPPAYSMGREAAEPCELGGYRVTPGLTIEISQWVTQRDPRWFADADRFEPGRWLDGLDKRLHRYAYFPFGGGPHLCIGNTFALMESVLVLATMLPRFRPRLAPAPPVVPWPSITLRPRHGIPVVVTARERSPAACPPSPV